jgi:hypothetical protein
MLGGYTCGFVKAGVVCKRTIEAGARRAVSWLPVPDRMTCYRRLSSVMLAVTCSDCASMRPQLLQQLLAGHVTSSATADHATYSRH